jgi:hypothetical protein
MINSWNTRKSKQGTGREELQQMPANNDWRAACERWIDQREGK